MLTETVEPRSTDWTSLEDDPSGDRIMLAIQYTIALIAVLAAGLLGLVH